MARYDNYRFQNLVRLLDLLAEKNPSMSDMRAIDQSCGTTFYTDLIYAREWPPYVTWFGYEDAVADLVTEYVIDSLPEGEEGKLDDRAGKLSGEAISLFTPTPDPELRTELKLDEFERGWFGLRRKFLLSKELKRIGLPDLKQSRITEHGRSCLAYAIVASQKAQWPLAAFCLAEFVVSEFKTRFIGMKQRAELNGLRYEELPPADAERSLIELLHMAELDADLKDLGKFSLWSFGGSHFVQGASAGSHLVETAFDFVARVRARVWPSPDHVRHFAELILNGSGEGRLLKILTI